MNANGIGNPWRDDHCVVQRMDLYSRPLALFAGNSESLVFIGVHVKYGEIPPIIMSAALGLLMAFIAYGRLVLKPIF